MSYERLCLLTKRVFPTLELLILDIGHYCCTCEQTGHSKRMMMNYKRIEALVAHSEQAEMLKPACSGCLIKLLASLPFNLEVHFYNSRLVAETFFKLSKTMSHCTSIYWVVVIVFTPLQCHKVHQWCSLCSNLCFYQPLILAQIVFIFLTRMTSALWLFTFLRYTSIIANFKLTKILLLT